MRFEHQQLHLRHACCKQLALPRDPSRLPLVSVLFNIDQALDRRGRSRSRACAASSPAMPRRFENFELFVNAVQDRRRPAAGMPVQQRPVRRGATVARWLGAYETLLRAASLADPDATVGALPLLSRGGPPRAARAAAGAHALRP